MKIAYCIICHRYTPVLEALVEWLSPDSDLYLHVDAKSALAPFEPLRRRGNVFFVEDRVAVYWGGWSLIEACLNALAATRGRAYDYISLLSGDTLPLRPGTQIADWLGRQAPGTEFVFEGSADPGLIKRLTYRYPQRIGPGGPDSLTRLRLKYKLLPRKRVELPGPPGKGEMWVTVTAAFRDYLFDYLREHPSYVEAFREGHCGDELFFHTLIRHSPFAGRVFPKRILYADWQGGAHPRQLDEHDFQTLAAAKQEDATHYLLFARKFSETLDLNAYRKQVLE